MVAPEHKPVLGGRVGRTYKDSTPWPEARKLPPKGAPDIIFVVLDDVGFSDIGCYGSEINTPNFDRLAQAGVRYANFHVMSLCSPTRSCLVTGRNAHSIGMGTIAEWAGGYPSYRGHISNRATTIAEILREHAYATLAVGKWHLTPMHEVTSAGPFTNWPLSRGFDHWYGFQNAHTNQWYPELFEDNHAIEAPLEDGYHLSEDLVDRAVGYIGDHRVAAPERPYFLYLAFGACHWPLHVPADVIAKYRGRYAAGWDEIRKERFAKQRELKLVPADTVLAERNPGVAEWSSLSEEDQTFAQRTQEVYAGFLDHTDQQIGRLLDYLETSGRMDNTMIVLLSDNGASAEGGPLGAVSLNARKHLYHGPETAEERRAALETLGDPQSWPHYAVGWAQVSNTPLKWYKMNTFGGGIRSPLIIHWPKEIKDTGGIRPQYHHVIDIVPTVLDVLNVSAPEVYNGIPQVPVHGTSLRYSFGSPSVPTRKVTQHFEMVGDRAIWCRGWKAVTLHQSGADFDSDRWELYHLDRDFSECHDLADAHPEKLQELIDLWWSEARQFEVLPLDDRKFGRTDAHSVTKRPMSYTYYPGLSRVDRINAPDMTDRSYSITAEVEISPEGAEGVLLAFGNSLAGYTLYVKDRHLIHEYAFSGTTKHVIESCKPITRGHHTFRYSFIKTDECGGRGTLLIDDAEVGSIEIPRTWPNRAAQGGLTCGRDSGLAVSDAYKCPFAFTGIIYRVVVDLGEGGQLDHVAAGLAAMIED